MNKELFGLEDRLIESIFRIKHINSIYPMGIEAEMVKNGVSMAQLTLMKTIRHNTLDSDRNTSISDIQKHLFTSTAAISKMLGILEKKGYINRDINKQNRRLLIITLTPKGREILEYLEKEIDKNLTEIITRLGKSEVEQLVKSINLFVDATDNR